MAENAGQKLTREVIVVTEITTLHGTITAVLKKLSFQDGLLVAIGDAGKKEITKAKSPLGG